MKFKYVFLIILGMITGCTLPNQRNPPQRADWINNWLIDPVCTTPCFENITPGKTSIDEAYQIFLNNPSNTDVRIDEVKLNTREYTLLFWSKYNPKNELYQPGVISTDNNTKRIVNRISLHLSTGKEYTTIRLNDLIQKFGDPQLFITYHEKSACAYGVVFSDYGMVAILNLVIKNTKVKLDSSSEIYYLELLPIDNMATNNFGFSEVIDNMDPWAGYGEYLCR